MVPTEVTLLRHPARALILVTATVIAVAFLTMAILWVPLYTSNNSALKIVALLVGSAAAGSFGLAVFGSYIQIQRSGVQYRRFFRTRRIGWDHVDRFEYRGAALGLGFYDSRHSWTTIADLGGLSNAGKGGALTLQTARAKYVPHGTSE